MNTTLTPLWFATQRNFKSTLAKFWTSFEQTDGCWIWKGTVNDKGYGRINAGDGKIKIQRAHQLSWLIHGNCIPAGMFVCHKCDIPLCVNPSHLFLGTCGDNIKDAINKQRNAFGERQWAHKLTRGKVEEIKQRIAAGERSWKLIAKDYGVSTTAIWCIASNRSWRWVKISRAIQTEFDYHRS